MSRKVGSQTSYILLFIMMDVGGFVISDLVRGNPSKVYIYSNKQITTRKIELKVFGKQIINFNF